MDKKVATVDGIVNKFIMKCTEGIHGDFKLNPIWSQLYSKFNEMIYKTLLRRYEGRASVLLYDHKTDKRSTELLSEGGEIREVKLHVPERRHYGRLIQDPLQKPGNHMYHYIVDMKYHDYYFNMTRDADKYYYFEFDPSGGNHYEDLKYFFDVRENPDEPGVYYLQDGIERLTYPIYRISANERNFQIEMEDYCCIWYSICAFHLVATKGMESEAMLGRIYHDLENTFDTGRVRSTAKTLLIDIYDHIKDQDIFKQVDLYVPAADGFSRRTKKEDFYKLMHDTKEKELYHQKMSQQRSRRHIEKPGFRGLDPRLSRKTHKPKGFNSRYKASQYGGTTLLKKKSARRKKKNKKTLRKNKKKNKKK